MSHSPQLDLGRTGYVWEFAERECLLEMPDEVWRELTAAAIEAAPAETGGTLVGYYSDGGRIAHTTAALVAGTGARRSRSQFYRPPDGVDLQLTDVYQRSHGRIHYLGEWHTHPGGGSTPSAVDRSTMLSLARDRSVAAQTPVLLVLGWDFSAPETAGAFVADPSGRLFVGKLRSQPGGGCLLWSRLKIPIGQLVASRKKRS